jgi:hypothetical protein
MDEVKKETANQSPPFTTSRNVLWQSARPSFTLIPTPVY